MKKGWELLTIKECCDILDSRRKPITKSKRESGVIPYYGATGLLDFVKDYIFDEPLVLLGEDGAKWGGGDTSAYRIEGKSWVNNHAHVLRPKREIINDYWLIYFLNYSNLQSYITGVTVPKLNQEKMCSIIVPIPPLSDQQSIVDFLDSAFAKIDAMKANAEKALNEAKALFQASLKEMLEPKEGWEEKKVKDVCRVINGRAYLQPEMLKEGKYKILRVGNFFTNGSWYYSDLELDEDKYCDNGDLLYAWSASFGPRIWNGGKVIYHYHIWKMACNGMINRDFMFYWLDSDELKKQAMTNLHGATMNHITKGIMENCIISFPILFEQKNIATTLDSLKSKVDCLQANYEKISQECDALKQAILRQVFE